jgi:signal transduction histidine kinase/ligand-binding sensor domain-containing protein
MLLGECATLASGVVPNYIARVWRTDDGLPSDHVTAVIQSRDGYIWIGTQTGLARFDGVRFTTFDCGNTPQMKDPHVTSLFEDEEGSIWIGHKSGELTCCRGREFVDIPVKAPWRGKSVFAIGEDAARDVWLLSGEGDLARARDWYTIPSPPGKAPIRVALVRNPRGGLWVQRDNSLFMLEGNQLRPVTFEDSPPERYIHGVALSRDGGAWISAEGRLRKWKDGRWIEDFGATPWGLSVAHSLIELKDGSLAVATAEHGLFLVFPGRGFTQFSRSEGFLDDNISTGLWDDREGNFWVGTGNSGLAMLRRGNITTVSPPDRWQGRAVLSVTLDPGGSLWVGTEGAGVYRLKDGNWTNFGENAGLGHCYVWSVAADAQGRIWAGTWGGSLFAGNPNGFALALGLENFSPPIPALLAVPEGGLLVGSGVGLMHYQAGTITWLAQQPEVALPDVRAVLKAPDGTLWFGMYGGGLGCIKRGKLRQFRSGDGLSSDFVQCLHLEDDGTLWIGTFAGLNRFKDGRFAAINKKQNLQNEIICAIADDGLGYFWISSHGGLMRVSKAELNQCADGTIDQVHCLTYGLSDGLPTLECSGGFQPASCKTADGRLWFPTSKGLVAVDTGNIPTNGLMPPVLIERLLVDDHPVCEGATPEMPLRIAPGQNRFEFQFAGLSFAAPERVRFRYRLEGLETKWVETQSPRRAYYSHLAPAQYRFHVLACNNDGVWNETGATLAFTVLPAFWQTWWFRALGGALLAAVGGGVVWLDARRRMRRRLERLERQRAIERERTRIAKDIHDDLGTGLTRISLLSESVPAEGINSPQVAEVLNKIFLTTHEMTQTMDEIVWAVNPRDDTLDSLATYLGRFAQGFLDSAGVRCRLDVPLQLPNWRLEAETRHHLFLAFKESLNNALRHAEASEVRISLVTGINSFTIIVEDNGKGFARGHKQQTTKASIRPGSRHGLVNMSQRLEQIGGHCRIASAVGKGTRVEFFVTIDPGATG